MRIVRALRLPGGLLPAASAVLAAIPAQYLHFDEHGRRHPASAYEASLRQITTRWTKVFEALNRLRTQYLWEQRDEHFPQLLDDYCQLLHRFHEHLDACHSSMRSLCCPADGPDTPFDVRFLDKAKVPGWKRFREVTKTYNDDHIGLIVNTLKHSQGELCGIYFWSSIDFRPGYFLRDILRGGALGPHRKLHDGGDTAFSFTRDMLLHLWQIFRVGEALAEAVTTFVRTKHSLELQLSPDIGGFPEWSSVIANCASLPPEFFPDETAKPYPLVLYNPRDGEVALEYPGTARGIQLDPNAQIRVAFTVDGNHLCNKMPYMTKGRR